MPPVCYVFSFVPVLLSVLLVSTPDISLATVWTFRRSAKAALWSRGIHVADPEGTMPLGGYPGRAPGERFVEVISTTFASKLSRPSSFSVPSIDDMSFYRHLDPKSLGK